MGSRAAEVDSASERSEFGRFLNLKLYICPNTQPVSIYCYFYTLGSNKITSCRRCLLFFTAINVSHNTVFADTPIDLCYDPCLAAFRSPMFIFTDCIGGGVGCQDILATKLDPSK